MDHVMRVITSGIDGNTERGLFTDLEEAIVCAKEHTSPYVITIVERVPLGARNNEEGYEVWRHEPNGEDEIVDEPEDEPVTFQSLRLLSDMTEAENDFLYEAHIHGHW